MPGYYYTDYPGAFANCPSLTTVNISEESQLQSIGSWAFYDCRSLTTITIPQGVTNIESDAFSGCYALAIVYNYSNLTITAESTDNGRVGEYAKEVVTADNPQTGSIEKIGNVKYYTNETTGQKVALYPTVAREILTIVTLEMDTTEINQYAFQDCSTLTTITIPEGVTSIEDRAFYNCYALAIVYNNSSLNIIAGGTDNGGVGQYAKEVVTASNPQVGSIETIDNVNYYVNETTNQKIALAPAVARDSLLTVTLASDTTEIVSYIFSNCTNLTSINFNNCQITSIPERAFYGCSSLTTITIPESVTSIGNSAFSDCTSLQSVDFGTNSSLQTIGGYAFQSCSSLTTITIPESVTSIGGWAFQYCYALAIVYNNSGLSIRTGYSGNGYVGYYAKEVVTNGQADGEIITENQVQYYVNGSTKIALLPAVARNALTSVTLASDTTEINQCAFSGCRNLQSVDFGTNSQLQTIGDNAFQGCSSLTTITIPKSVNSIGNNAFYNCYALAIVYNNSGLSIRTGNSGNGYVGYYAKEVVTNGQADGEIITENQVKYYVNGSTKIALAPAVARNALTTVTLASDTTAINQRAFENCTSLQTVNFGTNSQLQTIGDYAFYGCTSLTTITIPKGVETIEDSAFYYCTSLTTVVIESQYIYNNATSAYVGLLQYAQTVKVPTTIVNSYENSYLESETNFTPSTEMIGDVEYTVFTKVGA